ncbi:hypothetical protein [Fusibacter bizertensis]
MLLNLSYIAVFICFLVIAYHQTKLDLKMKIAILVLFIVIIGLYQNYTKLSHNVETTAELSYQLMVDSFSDIYNLANEDIVDLEGNYKLYHLIDVFLAHSDLVLLELKYTDLVPNILSASENEEFETYLKAINSSLTRYMSSSKAVLRTESQSSEMDYSSYNELQSELLDLYSYLSRVLPGAQFMYGEERYDQGNILGIVKRIGITAKSLDEIVTKICE